MIPFLVLLSSLISSATAAQDFRRSLEEILDRSTEIQTERTRVESARARAIPLRLYYAPNLDLEASQNFSGSTDSSTESYQRLQGRANLNLYRFGGDSAALSAGLQEIEASENQLLGQILVSEATAARALLTLTQKTLERDLAKQITAERRKHLRIARRRYQKGLLPLQEVNRVQIDLSNAEAAEKDAEISVLQAEETLRRLLGHSKIVRAWPWNERLKKTRALSSQWSLDAIPEWQSSQADLKRSEFLHNKTRSDLFPTLDSGFDYGIHNRTGFDSPSWTGTLSLSFPLFDRSVRRSEKRVAIQDQKAAEIAAEDVRRKSRARYDRAVQVFRKSRETTLRRVGTLQTARKLYEDNLKRFQKGRVNANDLAIDQDRVFNSEKLAIQGWFDYHEAYLELCHSLGKQVYDCP